MFNCLIVDDEAPARLLIARHVSQMPDLQIAGTAENAADALKFLNSQKVDLVFLDIMMPGGSGLELVRILNGGPSVILATAFREYATNAFDLEVLDYLVKPITRDRFLQSISKFRRLVDKPAFVPENEKTAAEPSMYFKVGREQVKIRICDVIYIEGLADYIGVHSAERSYVASETLSYVEQKLSMHRFVRVHKSFIVALDKVSSFTTDTVTLDSIKLPLGRSYKSGFLNAISQPPA